MKTSYTIGLFLLAYPIIEVQDQSKLEDTMIWLEIFETSLHLAFWVYEQKTSPWFE